MYIRTSTRAHVLALVGVILMGISGMVLIYFPAVPSSAVGKVDLPLPATTEVTINGTTVAQFPPPPGVQDTRPSVPASAEASVVATSFVTITDTLKERRPYTAPSTITLQAELNIPAKELAAIKPELSEHRIYAQGEEPKVSVTGDSQDIAKRYLAAFNAVRAKQNLPALIWDEDLVQRAEGHASTRLWYFLLDGGRQVSGPRDSEIDAYFGVGFNPRYPTIGMSSHGMPTTILVDTADEAAIMESLTDSNGNPLYGAGMLPVSRIGVGIALAQNGEAFIPHGWLTILFQ